MNKNQAAKKKLVGNMLECLRLKRKRRCRKLRQKLRQKLQLRVVDKSQRNHQQKCKKKAKRVRLQDQQLLKLSKRNRD